MTLTESYKRFKSKEECIRYLELIIWNNKPICPYCPCKRSTPVPSEQRYHCNYCKCSFSVTAKTIFHKTKVDLQKWFYAIPVIINRDVSARELAKRINVTKDTACRMVRQIKTADKESKNLIDQLLKQ